MQNQPALLCLNCCGLSSLVRQSSTRHSKPEGLMGASECVLSHIYMTSAFASSGPRRASNAKDLLRAGTRAHLMGCVVSSSGVRSAAKLSKQ